MLLPSIFWQMLLPFYFGAGVIALIEIDIILSKWQMLLSFYKW